MVTNVSTLGRNGLHDWLLLRASAVIIVSYVFYLAAFFITHSEINYALWYGFFSSRITKVFTSLTLLAMLIHSWIGLWQVLTDYVKSIKYRLVLQFLIIVVASIYVIYGTIVVWGI